MKPLLILAVLVAASLAGCGGKSADSSTTTGPPAVTEGTTTSHGSTSNHPPTGSLQPSTVAGAAPLVVNFTLDGRDQDHDALSWTLDGNGDGTTDRSGKTLPAVANFTYTAAGSFNVTFKLSDGKSEVSYTTAINVTASTVPLPPFVPITFSMMNDFPCQHCDNSGDASLCVGLMQGTQGLDCSWTEIPINAWNHPWTGTSVLAAAPGDAGIIWYDKCDSAGTVIALVDDNFGDEAGTVPEGTGCLIIFEAQLPGATITVNIT